MIEFNGCRRGRGRTGRAVGIAGTAVEKIGAAKSDGCRIKELVGIVLLKSPLDNFQIGLSFTVAGVFVNCLISGHADGRKDTNYGNNY